MASHDDPNGKGPDKYPPELPQAPAALPPGPLAAAALARVEVLDRQFEDPTRTDRPMVDRLIDAANICVRRKGFETTTLEEIAAEARVSRTSLYRHFPNREALFIALLIKRSKPFGQWSLSVVKGAGSAAERLETAVAGAVMDMRQSGWFGRAGSDATSQATVNLFRIAGRNAAELTLAPLVKTMIDDRAEAAGLSLDDLLEWLMEQMTMLARDDILDEERLRKRVRYFVISAIQPGAVSSGAMEERLKSIEEKLSKLGAR